MVKFKGMEGNATHNIALLDQQLAEVAQRREVAVESIRALGDQRSELKLAFDRLNQDVAVEAAKDDNLTDGIIVFLEGWAAVPKLDKLEQELKALDCAYELTDPQEGDQVPHAVGEPQMDAGHQYGYGDVLPAQLRRH